MWREIRRVSDEKPLVATMGDVAASGGYYMGMASEDLLAHPLTITGSIGVVTGKFNLEGLYEKVCDTCCVICAGKAVCWACCVLWPSFFRSHDGIAQGLGVDSGPGHTTELQEPGQPALKGAACRRSVCCRGTDASLVSTGRIPAAAAGALLLRRLAVLWCGRSPVATRTPGPDVWSCLAR